MAGCRVSLIANRIYTVLIVSSSSCQWSPHPVTSNLILTTSSQKLLIWDLRSTSPSSCLSRLIFAHARSITDINWHARDPNLMATTSIDGSVKGWDLRVGDNNRAVIRLADWGDAGTQVKWNRQHDYMIASAHGNRLCIWDTRVSILLLSTSRVLTTTDAERSGSNNVGKGS
jgi:WD40 repeat protein